MKIVVRIPASPAIRWVPGAYRFLGGTPGNLIRVGRAFVAGLSILTWTFPASTHQTALPAVLRRPSTDRRAEKLTAFFEMYRCREHHVEQYLRAADLYGLDYRLLPAISVRETTCGLTEQDNNWWGYHPGRAAFRSVEDGIDYVARQLGKEVPYRGKSLRQKLFTYNPRPAYPGEVEAIMRQIE